ncbi:MAG: hypothetical protein ACOX04_08835 [Candidatus Scatomorpha sp.]|jgi:hypothetical protein
MFSVVHGGECLQQIFNQVAAVLCAYMVWVDIPGSFAVLPME